MKLEILKVLLKLLEEQKNIIKCAKNKVILYLFYQYGSLKNSTLSSFLSGTEFMQARMTSPLTSISHAPQLPPRHPVGIWILASYAAFNQSTPG